MVDKKPAAIEPKNPEAVKKAIAIGQASIKDGNTKVAAVRLMFPLIAKEQREVIWSAFQAGAGLTEKGAMTYHYNLIREGKRTKSLPQG